MPLHDVSPADPPTAANALPVPSAAFSHWTFPGWFSLVLEPREPLRPHDRRDAPPAAGVHLVTPTPWTQERRPPGPRSYRSSLHAQHKARHTACDHKRDLSARKRLDWTWCNPHPGKVPFRGGPTRPGNAGVSCTAGIGMAAGPTAATDGPGAWSAAGRPLAGGSHQEREQHPPPGGRARTGIPPLPSSGRRSGIQARRAEVPGAAGATHPMQVEALGAARGLLGAGAQAHGNGRAPAPVPRTRALTRCRQHGLALSALDYQRLVTWAPRYSHP